MSENLNSESPAAQRLLDGLYANGAGLDANWEGFSDESLVKLRSAAVSGDEAVQALLVQLAFSKFQDSEQALRLSASLAGIKAAAVTEIFDEFPTTSVDDLRAAAEAAGYEVEVLA